MVRLSLIAGKTFKKLQTILSVIVFFSTTTNVSLAQDVGANNTTIKTLAPLPENNSSDKPPAIVFTPQTEEANTNKDTVAMPATQTASTEATKEATNTSADTVDNKPEALAQKANTESNSDADTSETTDSKGQAIAQSTNTSWANTLVDPAHTKLPTKTGTVQIRKQFKLFAKEELIHNLSFRDTSVREVIAEIARRGNLNVIIDKSVLGRVTGDLHDVTLNEAMDSVLAAAGLQNRVLENNTVIIATPNAMVQLGLNRPMARAFKLSYTNPYEVANIIYASVFNRGIIPDFQASLKDRFVSATKDNPKTTTQETIEQGAKTMGENGGERISKSTTQTIGSTETADDTESGTEFNQTSRPDAGRSLRGISRTQLQEGTGFNNAATDPGSQQIRAYQEVPTDFTVEQNGGGAIVIPDVKNRQIIIVGTPDDLAVAEECINLIDRRPKQVHIQASLIELRNEGIRQLGASLALQGEGASASILGGTQVPGQGAPLVQFLPGMGSPGTIIPGTGNGTTQTIAGTISGIPPAPTAFNNTVTFANGLLRGPFTNTTTTAAPANQFPGVLGTVLPGTPPTIARIQANPTAQSGFNFLTLGTKAGGRANIATLPTGLNVSVNLLLQTNKAKLLANPSVVVSDNTEALITLANEVIHKVTSTVSLGVVSTNVELTKAGVFLNVMPRVAEDGFITMRLRPQVSTPLGPPQVFAGGNTIITLLSIREIISQEVRVKDGQTLIIGGLFSEEESAQLSKVPYLAETPILGALFRNSLKGRNRSELMLMLTPKIVEEQPDTAISDTNRGVQM
jgi:type II secretory pathway component GspD/PulD (secretin)